MKITGTATVTFTVTDPYAQSGAVSAALVLLLVFQLFLKPGIRF